MDGWMFRLTGRCRTMDPIVDGWMDWWMGRWEDGLVDG